MRSSLQFSIFFAAIHNMSHCRIFTTHTLSLHAIFPLADDIAHYLHQVMRLHEGDEVTVFDGKGGEYQAQIEQISKRHVSCYTTVFNDICRELSTPIHIIQCASKSEKIETVLQKGTELGAASFHIANSQRSELKLAGVKLEKRVQRWQRIIIEAAEQSERTAIPDLFWHPHLRDVPCLGQGFALHPHQAKPWQDVRQSIVQATHLSYAVGPEGGWSLDDLNILNEIGFETLTFGTRIMRTETAAPALLAATQALML